MIRRARAILRALTRLRGRPAVLGLLLVAAPLLAQQEEDITGAIEKYRGLVALANQKLDDLDLPEALARFSEVIDGYNSGKLPSNTALTRQIVGQAYEGRARTYANLGRNAEAEADFETLLRFDVAWPIDRTRTSPKIVALYDKVRKRLVGTLSVKSEPPGALVSLNGSPIGRTPVFDKELPAGPYEMKIEAEGFDPIVQQINIAGGARFETSPRLAANARDLLVATTPAGAKVSLDGVERGTTFGAAGPEYTQMAARLSVSLTDISAPLQVGHASPGNHLLRIEKECFETQTLSITVALDPNDAGALRYEPVKLTPSLGSLSLETTPIGAEALLDGKPVGKTPVKLDSVCSGRHQVTLRLDGVGQWSGPVDVTRGQRASINERPRLTLAYVGMAAAGPPGQAPAGEKELADALQQLKSFNLFAPDAGLAESLLARKRANPESDLTAADLDAVASATGADLVMVSRPGQGGFGSRIEITMIPATPGLASIRDRLDLSLDDKSQVKDLLARIDTAAALSAPWIGLETIELHRSPNPIIIRVQPGSPAAKAGARVGESVVSLGGKGVSNPRDLAAALAGLREGAQASLALQAPGVVPRQVNLTVGTTPVMLPPSAAGQLSARRAAELLFRARLEAASGRGRSDERTSALLSLAGLLMDRGQCDQALKLALEPADPKEGAGLSAGTVNYLKGVCLMRTNRQGEARQQLALASGQPDATLWSHDGPPVSERARRLLGP